MNSSNKLNAYRVNAVGSASPANLVVMLYDGAIRFLAAAIRAFEHEDPLDFNLTVHTNITKTQAIIRELNHALDLDNGGELCEKLAGLYDYFDNRLQEANIKKDKLIIEEILERIGELRDAWSEALSKQPSALTIDTAEPTPHPSTPQDPSPKSPSSAPSESSGLSLIG